MDRILSYKCTKDEIFLQYEWVKRNAILLLKFKLVKMISDSTRITVLNNRNLHKVQGFTDYLDTPCNGWDQEDYEGVDHYRGS